MTVLATLAGTTVLGTPPAAGQFPEWFVRPSCTSIQVMGFGSSSPYGMQVEIAPAAGGDALDVTPLSFLVPQYTGLGATPDRVYDVVVTDADGTTVHEEAVTTTVSCPSPPEAEVLVETPAGAMFLVHGTDTRTSSVQAMGESLDGRPYGAGWIIGGQASQEARPDGLETVLTMFHPWSVGGQARMFASDGQQMSDDIVVDVPAASTSRAVLRHAGPSRIATAAELARHAILRRTSTTTLVVASAVDFPDALAASNLDAPVLLTDPATLSPETEAVVREVQPREVFVAGGPAAISDQVMRELASALPGRAITRIGGESRYHTAAMLTERGHPREEPSTRRIAFVASGATFPDALAASSLAARVPLVLTDPSGLVEPAAAQLRGRDLQTVYLVGGPAALAERVREDIAAELPDVDIERISGPSRTATAAAVAELAFSLGIATNGEVVLARGDRFPDALAAAPLASAAYGAILLTPAPDRLGDDARAILDEHGCETYLVHLAGGTSALDTSVAAEVAAECKELAPLGLGSEDDLGALIVQMHGLYRDLDGGAHDVAWLPYLIGDGAPTDQETVTFENFGPFGAAGILGGPVAATEIDDIDRDEVDDDGAVALWVDADLDGICDPDEHAADVDLSGDRAVATSRTC